MKEEDTEEVEKEEEDQENQESPVAVPSKRQLATKTRKGTTMDTFQGFKCLDLVGVVKSDGLGFEKRSRSRKR